jgi:hypothetical protein
MTNHQRIAKDEPERIVLNNIAEFGWHAVNIIEDNGCPPWTFTIGLYETYGFPELIILGRSRSTAIVRLAGPFVHPCTRPATASQAREPDSPSGFLGEAPTNPLSLPCDKGIP